MKALRAACVALGLLLPGIAAAQSSPVVVELYTSQGCSSCPPADALLHQLAAREDVLPLALHVDYWDYIGWKDQFADPSHAKRQKAYAHVAGRKMIYTPQMIVMGQEDVVGVDTMKLADLITQHRANLVPVFLTAQRTGNTVVLDLVSDLSGPQDLVVQLVRYAPVRDISITRGELAGKTMSYANVVADWQILGSWDGFSTTQMSFDVTGEDKAAIVVQQAGLGAVMAAVRID
ncbi:DUF1223 domain-containing protein [Aliisedimentitalea scapharcae]|uniref:DUF1223 domain-containing protein n=1 Tax=Aliisedimentitalea scapharcae TaxID=1524259 RepID=A0ABZ2XZD7_9RHOB|nr:DUF1223 domain-containing protein [Rhodobacteraceae bacterium M382]